MSFSYINAPYPVSDASLYTFKSELLLWTRIWSELSIDIFSLRNFNSSIDFEHNSLTECQLNLDKISWYKPLVWTLTAWSTAASIDISWPAMLAMTLTWILFCPDLTYFKTSSNLSCFIYSFTGHLYLHSIQTLTKLLFALDTIHTLILQSQNPILIN